MKEGVKRNRGQITLFVILAMLVVALVIVAFLLYPKLRISLGFGAGTPAQFMQDCMEDAIKNNAKTISSQGGTLTPENYFLYDGEKVEYLCYTNEYYAPCIVQQPLLKQYIEKEIKDSIKTQGDSCLNSLKESYEKQGYQVSLGAGELNAELLPKRIVASFSNEIVLDKEGTSRYKGLEIVVNNNLYELISIANSIVSWETKFGDAETATYMNYYKDLKAEKKKQTDGTKVYILTDRNTGNKFQFASRSMVLPPGYGYG